MDRELALTRDSPIRVQLGFAIEIIVIVAGMAIGYGAIRSDLRLSVKAAQENKAELDQIEKNISKLTYDLGMQSQKLEDFHASYERDFNTYIREVKR